MRMSAGFSLKGDTFSIWPELVVWKPLTKFRFFMSLK